VGGDPVTAPADNTHRCPARRCPRRVQPDLLMCGIHWRMVPKPLQRAVWAAWRHGEGQGTIELIHAQDAAIRAVNNRTEHTTDV